MHNVSGRRICYVADYLREMGGYANVGLIHTLATKPYLRGVFDIFLHFERPKWVRLPLSPSPLPLRRYA